MGGVMIGLPLVQYECGCIGLAPDAQGRILIMMDSGSPCDNDMGFWQAEHHEEKRYLPMPEDRAIALTQELNKLVQEGYRFRDIKHALREPGDV
jgi:hypothetical protein